MKLDNDATAISHEQGLLDLETENAPTFSDKSETLIIWIKQLRLENEKLKGKKAICDGKDKLLAAYEVLVDKLQEECKEKGKQLTLQKKQLVNRTISMKQLQVNCDTKDKQIAEQDEHLQLMLNEINDLQAKSNEKDAKLAENASLIANLKTECDKKDAQLAEKINAIKELQMECIKKDLAGNASLDEQLKAKCDEKDSQMKATFDRMKTLGKNMHNSADLLKALSDCVRDCCDQKLHTEAIVHLENAVELENSTQNRPEIMAKLLSTKAFCHVNLKQYQLAIETANLSLQHDSNHKNALFARACAGFDLGQYANARRDLKKCLRLDSTDNDVREFLEDVQKRINASNSQ